MAPQRWRWLCCLALFLPTMICDQIYIYIIDRCDHLGLGCGPHSQTYRHFGEPLMSSNSKKPWPGCGICSMCMHDYFVCPNFICVCWILYCFPRIHGKPDLVTIGTNHVGKKVITGKSKNLEKSAEYPIQFGLAIATLIRPTDGPARSPDWVDGSVHVFCFFNVLLLRCVALYMFC